MTYELHSILYLLTLYTYNELHILYQLSTSTILSFARKKNKQFYVILYRKFEIILINLNDLDMNHSTWVV